MLGHEFFLRAHSPEKKGTEDDEKKNKSAPADDRRAHGRNKASGIHRMPHVAVWTRCYQFRFLLGGDSLAPVLAEGQPRPNEEDAACNTENGADDVQCQIYRCEADEPEYRKMRKQEGCDYGKQEAETLPQVRFRVALCAECGNGQVHDEYAPGSIYEPHKN